ncbi:MAG: hypothetical protein JWO57_839 [Pseudonocardiales bacterium]|nr:hypothetical protein [Pseudonocardiales bacterium]
MYIAHRGGDADWPEGTAYAYARAAAWNSNLALEVPVWRTSDGVWVVSEDATTSRVFGQNYTIRDTPWATLAGLRGLHGGQPMARLVNDVLDVYGRSRILFIDDKSDTNVAELLDLLDSFAGPSRYVVKSFCRSVNAPKLARARGYLTWGYYFAKDMSIFESTQSRFDMVGLNYMAPSANFTTMHDTGKPVVAHIISTTDAARTALANGVQGLMVSAVEQVVPPQSH